MIKFPSLNSTKTFLKSTIGIWSIIIVLMVSVLYSYPVKADHDDEIFEACYAIGMIGFDSVKNARLNVYPESALAMLDGEGMEMPEDIKAIYIRVILGAYLWEDDPHSYALLSYNDCLLNGK